MKKKELKAENKRLTILVDRLNIRVEELRKANDMVAGRYDCYMQKLFQLLSELESSRNGAQDGAQGPQGEGWMPGFFLQ